MLVSTKGRYALRVMIDLAENGSGQYTPLMDIALRQGVSEKYLESIVSVLSKSGFLTALRGKGGGYKLSRSPESYTVGSVLKLTEGSLSPVSCLAAGKDSCERAEDCRTLPLWLGLDKLIDEYLEDITLADLMHNCGGGDYVI